MIHALRYLSGNDGPSDVDAGRLREAVDADAGLVWIDVEEPTDAELDSLAAQLDLSPFAVEDLHHGGQRTKLERYGDHFHVAIHDCALIESDLVTREVDVVFGDGWLLSVRQPPTASATTRRSTSASRAAGSTPAAATPTPSTRACCSGRSSTSSSTATSTSPTRSTIASTRSRSRSFSGDGNDAIPREIFDLRRSMVHVPAGGRAAARGDRRRCSARKPTASAPRRSSASTTCYDHVLRVVDLIETQRDLLTGLLEANLAVASNRLNDVMKKMTSWGAILLVATLIAGIYGMNFEHMPELRWEFGYPVALGSMVVLTIVLYTLFKKKGWL